MQLEDKKRLAKKLAGVTESDHADKAENTRKPV